MMQPVSPPTIDPSRPSVLSVYQAIQRQTLVYTAAAGETLPSFGMGAKDVFNHNHSPRISWQPMGGSVDPIDSGYRDNPRALWTRNFLTVAMLWAADIDAANELANHLVAAIDAVIHGSYRVVRERWDVTGDRDAGNVVAVHFVVEIPLIDDVKNTAQFVRMLIDGHFTQEATN